MSIFRKSKKKKADLKEVTTMELNEFVRHTLTHIVTGVKKAQDDVKDIGGKVNPTGVHWRGAGEKELKFIPGWGIIQDVEFDLSVTSSEATSTGGGLKIPLYSVEGGAQMEREKSLISMNRIKFIVPVLFPSKFFDWDKLKKEQEEKSKKTAS